MLVERPVKVCDSIRNFEPRCFPGNVERTISVPGDLCIRIDKAFRELGIGIPFPLQDVYVKQFVAASQECLLRAVPAGKLALKKFQEALAVRHDSTRVGG